MIKDDFYICMSIEDLLSLITAQSEDLGLWGIPQTPEEEYLQQALRKLHNEIERVVSIKENG